MKKVKVALIVFILVLLSLNFTGCFAMVLSPANGIFYTNVRGSHQVVDNEVGMGKIGTATAQSIMGMICTGDASIKAAMDDAGITKIHHVDYESTSILGIIASYTVIVYGE